MSKRQPETTKADAVPFDKDTKYTVKQIAEEHLHKSTKTVYDLIKTRKLKAYRFGREYLVTDSQLNEFANDRLLKKWFPELTNQSELDPSYVPPEEVDIDSLTEAQILAAYVIPTEWLDGSPQNAGEWIELARLVGLDKSDQPD